MGIVDFILNLAGLLLWLNWRSNRFDPLVKRQPATLMARCGRPRPAPSGAGAAGFHCGLLLLRAVVYWWVGSQASWPER